LADAVLHPKGIVAVDDFLNTECLGVIEAVCRFLDRKPLLAPFLFTSGKLFMAPIHHVGTYKSFLESFAAQDQHASSVSFTTARQHNKKWQQSDFCGHEVLIM
jgi:hypothetical protein